ncbi:hypothetical protein HYV88_05655 [Candidatus Woesearchaeota archaeon]|nr:hypothetical protein [Candidatus Woesearchaeota archaeon]
MNMLDSIKEEIFNKIVNIGLTSETFFADLIISIILIVFGIFLGKLVKFILRNALEKIKVDKIIKQSFINLFLVVVKWSIYILFIDISLMQLNLPVLTIWLTTILGVIPSLTGALIIISAGFAIATYLKKVVSESKIENGVFLSKMFFYFVNYIFMIFAFKTALISLQDKFIVNILLVVFTILGSVALLIYYFKSKH